MRLLTSRESDAQGCTFRRMLRLPPTQLDPARRIRRHPVSELGVVPNFVKRTATNVAQLAETYFRPLSLYLVCIFFGFVICLIHCSPFAHLSSRLLTWGGGRLIALCQVCFRYRSSRSLSYGRRSFITFVTTMYSLWKELEYS